MHSPRKVFVIHGRNDHLRAELFTFLRAIGLDPIEWSEAVHLTSKGAPYIGDVLDHAFCEAAAVIVLLTPDDDVRLAPELIKTSDGLTEREYQRQPRPNVIFEAGMAFGRYPDRTILVVVGTVKQFSDIAGRHVVHLSNDPERRLDLVNRLEIAGCDVRASLRRDWLKAGNFETAFQSDAKKTAVGDARLSDIEVEVFRAVAQLDGVTALEVAKSLGISKIAAEHYLEVLEGHGFLHALLAIGRPPVYVLDRKGRAYAVGESLA